MNSYINQVVLVGKLIDEPIVEKNRTKIEVGVPRNEEVVDVIECILWNGIASATKEYSHKGDTVGVKGRIQIENGVQVIICERITLLSSNKAKEEEK